ncbi:MAG: septum formation initiator family protein [bacterium]|nr:septum formation initiator family protein [bacterium]
MATLRPNFILIATAIIAVLILFSLAQEMNRRWQVQREVTRLEADVNKMERKVVELEQLNAYFSTQDYKERLAREQLNFRAPGEKVVLIPERVAGAQQTNPTASIADATLSIPLRWWYLFFVQTPKK